MENERISSQHARAQAMFPSLTAYQLIGGFIDALLYRERAAVTVSARHLRLPQSELTLGHVASIGVCNADGL